MKLKLLIFLILLISPIFVNAQDIVLQTERGNQKYNILIQKGQEIEKELVIFNKGLQEKTVEIKCVGDSCNLVKISPKTLVLPPNIEFVKEIILTIQPPTNKFYKVNITAEDSQVEINVTKSFLAFFLKPSFLISFITVFIIILILAIFISKKRGKRNRK